MKVVNVRKEYDGGNEDFFNIAKREIMGDGGIVTKIEYHSPGGDGDAHFCDVYFDNGKMKRLFRPDMVCFEEEEEE